MTSTHWIKDFVRACKVDTKIRNILACNLNSAVQNNANMQMCLECGREIAKYAMNESEIRSSFLGFVILFLEKYNFLPDDLFESFNSTIKQSPIILLDFYQLLANAILNCQNVDKVKLQSIIDILKSYHEEQVSGPNPDHELLAHLREAFSKIIPRISGYDAHPPRLSGNNTITAKFQVLSEDGSENDTIEGYVLDIDCSGKPYLARGIQIQTPEWEYILGDMKPQYFGEKRLFCYGLTAVHIKEKKKYNIHNPTVNITWPSGEITSETLSVRGFKNNLVYNMPGGAIVLFLIAENLESWVKYTQNLMPIEIVMIANKEGRGVGKQLDKVQS